MITTRIAGTQPDGQAWTHLFKNVNLGFNDSVFLGRCLFALGGSNTHGLTHADRDDVLSV